MNLCKIGWHDWEVFSDQWLLWEKVRDALKILGFQEKPSEIGSLWRRDRVVLAESLPFDQDDLDYQIPSNAYSKVCLRCGKTHKNYSEEKVISKVHELVLEKEAELVRRKKAEEMLGRTN